jgi:hypothetical protein
MNFLLLKPSPNVFKFIVNFNIFDKKKHHVLILLGAHVLDFDFWTFLTIKRIQNLWSQSKAKLYIWLWLKHDAKKIDVYYKMGHILNFNWFLVQKLYLKWILDI